MSILTPQEIDFSDPDALHEEGGEILVDLAAFFKTLEGDDE